MSNRYKGGIISATPPTTTGGESGTASGAWTLEQQMQAQAAGLWPLQPTGPYIEDVFSTWLYTGNNSTQTIANGIDLAGKGGLVWIKERNTGGYNHRLFDTVRGINQSLSSNTTSAQFNTNSALNAFNSTGFTLGPDPDGIGTNTIGITDVSWTFREQPKFFSIATWTGNGVNGRVIPHNLGSTPGCILVKRVSGGFGEDWQVYHRSLNSNQNLVLNTAAAAAVGVPPIFGTVDSTGFQLLDGGAGNSSGYPYIAYLFAHNAGGFGLSGTDNVISCGSYTGNGSANGPTVTLGYEPQWLLVKNASAAESGGLVCNWRIYDNMRGWATGGSDARLFPNVTAAENPADDADLTATGFKITTTAGNVNGSGETFIYIAIRRGPMRTPTTGTSVFYPETVSQAATIDSTNVPFPPDLVNTFSRNGTSRTSAYNQFMFVDRLRGLGTPNNTYSTDGPALVSSSTSAEGAGGVGTSYVQLKADSRNITRGGGWMSPLSGNFIYYFMRRAPGFFDEVCYTGTGSARTVAHNLTVVPEMMIVKSRSAADDWPCYFAALGATTYVMLNRDERDGGDSGTFWGSTAPTSSVFTVGTDAKTNGSGITYVAYLFASCPGVSKVGSYTGTGTTQVINCGFTGGARFVMIKRTNGIGDWYVWDSARGIVAGDDPYLLINSTAVEVTNTDFVDTAATGFEITSTAPAAINANGGTFIFLAIS